MEYSEFLEFIKNGVEERLSKEYQVTHHPVLKNNNTLLDGMVIMKKEEKISPTIYLNFYYEQYLQGEFIENIITDILEVYFGSLDSKVREDWQVTMEFGQMRENIIYRIINYEKNEVLLDHTPHIVFLDLAVVFYCLVEKCQDGIATIRITRELMEEWNIDVETLMNIAKENTPRLFPASIRTMNEVLGDIFEKNREKFEEDFCESFPVEEEERSLFVMSNLSGINGATTLLYPDIMEEFSDRLKSDFYILPSSIHEVILVPKQPFVEREALKKMVCEVNLTQVPKEEILSNQVYAYHRDTHSFVLDE